MEKKRRRNRGSKSNNNQHLQSPEPVSSFDTSGLPSHLAGWFKDADDMIQSKFTILSKHEEFLQASRDKAVRDIDACFDKIVQVANRRKQLLKGELGDIYQNQLEYLLEKKESVLLSGMFLETLLRQSKKMTVIGEEDKLSGFEDMVHREIDRHCSMALNNAPTKNLIEFDRMLDNLEPLERKIRMTGRLRTDYSLPVSVTVTDCNVVVGLQSHIEVQVLGGLEEALPPSLFNDGLLSFQLNDKRNGPVHYRLDSNEQEKTICILFTPVALEKHTLSVLFSGQPFKEIEVHVKENLPTLAFGLAEGLIQPNALCSLVDGRVCIADSGASKLLLFSNTGSLIAEMGFPEGGFVPFDVTAAPKGTYVLCSGSAYDDQDDTLSASTDENDTVMPLEMTEESHVHESPELPKDKDKPSVSKSATSSVSHTKSTNANHGATCGMPEVDDLRITEGMLDTVCVRYIERRGYVTVTDRNHVILGEVKTNTIQVYDNDGRFLRVLLSPTLDCLGAVQYKPDGQVVVSDIGHCRLLTGTPDAGLGERWGSVETESKQLLLPLGLALDGAGNLLVADGGGPRVFIYGEWGEYIGRLELGPPGTDCEAVAERRDADADASALSPGSSGSPDAASRGVEVSVIPWALTVVGNTVWVIDNNSHKVLRYSYCTPN